MTPLHVPDVSIIVPTFGQPERLRACLEGIAQLEFPRERLEAIVVNDGGPDELGSVVAAVSDRIPLRLVSQANQGPGAARNTGAALATGRWLAFVDDDCVPSRHWVSALVRELEAHPDWLVGGLVLNGLSGNPYSTCTQLLATYVSEYYAERRATQRFFTTNNVALAADRFRELGGFSTSIPSATAEDKEFCERWRARGWQMAWVRDAVVHHSHDLTLWRFLRQHYNYGRGLLHFHLMRRRRGARRLAPEPLGFYVDLLLYPLKRHAPRRGWRFVLLLLLSQLATGAGAAKAALTERPPPGPPQTLEGVDRADA